MLRYEGQGRLTCRCDCAAILDHERTGGARPVAGWCILHASTLVVVTTTTAGVIVLHAEPLCEERASARCWTGTRAGRCRRCRSSGGPKGSGSRLTTI